MIFDWGNEMNPQIKNRFTDAVIYEGESGMTARAMLEKATATRVNLRGANLRSANLRSANLRSANLRGADLRGADLYGADLGGANLRSANLRSANLRSADLRSANLRSADLYGADLYGADLYDADLRDASLYGANLYGADLRGANLYGADLGEEFGKLIESRPFFQCGPIGSRADYLLSFATDKGLVIKAGCFTSFIDEFVAAVEKTHGGTDHGKEYAMAILMIEAHAAIWRTK